MWQMRVLAVATFAFNTPFDAQVEFLRNKLRLPTERWDDIQRSAHDRAFIVAGAAKADLLADLHNALIQRTQDGLGLEAFRKDFAQIVARNGWTGFTGDGSAGGIAWRTKVIYQTNMSTSYAAGRWQQLNDPSYRRLRPYWRYVHSDSVQHPRPVHKRWGDMRLTLRYDHPFWLSHFPPNGWGCQCRVVAVDKDVGDALGPQEPPPGWNERDAKGRLPGIDTGFDYAPGANTKRTLQALVDDKLLKLDAPIGADMWQALKPALLAERSKAWATVVDATLARMTALGETTLVHTVDPATVSALAREGVVLENAAIWMRDNELLHALRDAKSARGAVLPNDVLRNLPEQLDTAEAYLDTKDQALIYAIDLGKRLGKVVVRVNYNERGRFDGARARITSNFVQTAGMVDKFNLREARYLPLKK